MCKWNVGYYAICRLVPVFNVLDVNEFSNIWVIVALHFLFVFWKSCLSGWLELREHCGLLENWTLLQQHTQEQFFVSVVWVGSWCGPSRIRWIYSFSLPFSDPILFRMFTNLVWYLLYIGHAWFVTLPVLLLAFFDWRHVTQLHFWMVLCD